MVKVISNREYNALQKTKIRFEVEIERVKEELNLVKLAYEEALEKEYQEKKLALDKDYTSRMHDLQVKCREDMKKIKEKEAVKREKLEKELTKVLTDGINKVYKKLK